VLAALPPAEREALLRTVLDQFRRKLAMAVRCLHETTQQQMCRRASGAGYAPISLPVNAFFQRFYRDSAAALAALEAREHTAQVVTPGERERRERRFRWEDSDTRKVSDLGRRLPYLVCSPTMELGVDIADLDLVHLRNVPPTPANYAQRSGRAERQGQPGLVFTYCGALNSHDQYFFHRRAEMVAGSVRPPRLDLANDALLRAHIQAAWLAQVRLPLGQSIEQVLDTDQEALPPRENVAGQIQLGAAARDELRQRVQHILTTESGLLASTDWFTPAWVDRMLAEAPQHFDRAFDRWRELYRAATRQLIEAQHALLRARRSEEQTQAAARQQEALRQRNLLLQVNTAREESDFYPYMPQACNHAALLCIFVRVPTVPMLALPGGASHGHHNPRLPPWQAPGATVSENCASRHHRPPHPGTFAHSFKSSLDSLSGPGAQRG
jgi:hypothetical protein